MSTWWQIRISGEDASQAAQAAAEAFRRVDDLEQYLSRFRGNSDIARIAAASAGSRVRVSPWTVDCLAEARELGRLTGGRFCVGVRTPEGDGSWELDPPYVIVCKAPCLLDLGAVGKGFAVDRAAELLGEWGIECHLVSSGGSSLRASGAMAWPVGVGETSLNLRANALGASGYSARGSHLLAAPGVTAPFAGWERTWALAPRASLADALSTAAMWWTAGEAAAFCAAHPGTGLAVLGSDGRTIFSGCWPDAGSGAA